MSFSDLSRIPDAVKQGIDSEEARVWYARVLEFFHFKARRQVGPALGARHHPSDFAQEAVIAVNRELVHFRGEGRSFRAWASRILQYGILGASRGVRSRPEGPSDGISRVQAADPGPEAVAVRNEENARVHEMLAGLSELDQEILDLHGLQERTFAEIAPLLGLTSNMVAGRYYRALRRLRGEMETGE